MLSLVATERVHATTSWLAEEQTLSRRTGARTWPAPLVGYVFYFSALFLLVRVLNARLLFCAPQQAGLLANARIFAIAVFASLGGL